MDQIFNKSYNFFESTLSFKLFRTFRYPEEMDKID